MAISKSTLLHLRFPFSLFLMPVFCFAIAVGGFGDTLEVFGVWFIWHILVYPASNGYNSYFDKDEGSIGGLEKPPEVKKDLYTASLVLDVLALLICVLFYNYFFALLVLAYGLASKAYSHPSVRLKKMPVAGLLTVTFFQGAVVYAATQTALYDLGAASLLQKEVLLPALLSSLLLFGAYPMTQIYQHEEDGKRGDKTISRMLGIRGTFIFTASVFSVVGLGFFFFFESRDELGAFGLFMFALFPVLVYFSLWMLRAFRDADKADFKSTMRLNFISAICLNAFFMAYLILREVNPGLLSLDF